MRNILLGLTTGIITLLIGIYASTPTALKPPQVEVTDFEEYSVDLRDLVAEPDRYDGKIIRVKGWFTPLKGSSVGNFAYDRAWVRVICVTDQISCSKLFTQTDNVHIYPDPRYIEVVGRFQSNASDPHPLQRGNKVCLLEIYKVISPGQGQGQGQGHGSGSASGDSRGHAEGHGSGGSY